MSKGAPDYTKIVSLKGRDASGNDVSVLVDSTGRILAVLQGAVEITGTVNATPTTTVRQMQGSDGAQYRDLATDTAGRLVALIRGVYGSDVLPVALDSSGTMIARVRGKYGSTLIDAAVDSVGRLITATATETQRSNAAMDAATADGLTLSGANYVISGLLPETGDASSHTANLTGYIGFMPVVAVGSGAVTYIKINIYAAAGNCRVALYADSAGVPGALLAESASVALVAGWNTISIPSTNVALNTQYWFAFAVDSVSADLFYKNDSSSRSKSQGYGAFPDPAGSTSGNAGTFNMVGSNPLSGTIKSNALVATAADLRYWRSVRMNLSKGGSTHANPLRIKFFGSSDSYAAALNANWVTIPEAEYAELDLERAVVKTATGNAQTVWDYTSLTGADVLVNEIGAQSVLVVERANDGSTYSVLTEDVDYTLDLTSRVAPRITLASGTGIVSGTSKLRATMVVDVLKTDQATKNTSIKVQIQENRTAAGETSPSIAPMPTEATVYISALWVMV